jgi:DNA-binding transcriptional LysR family regulator
MLWHGFRKLGTQPRIVCEVIDKSTLLQFVLQGLGLALAPAWIEFIAPAGLSFIPFESDQRRIALYVAYRSTGNHAVIEDFVNDVKQVARASSSGLLNRA